MLQGKTNLMFALSILLLSLSIIMKLIPLFILGVLIMVSKYKDAFNPAAKDSLYRPEVQRDTAYILLALALLEGITGFGAGPQTSTIISQITFGLLNRGNSLTLHLFLIAPLSFFFILHSTSGLGNLLIRKGIKNRLIYTLILPLTMISLFSIAFYLDTLYF